MRSSDPAATKIPRDAKLGGDSRSATALYGSPATNHQGRTSSMLLVHEGGTCPRGTLRCSASAAASAGARASVARPGGSATVNANSRFQLSKAFADLTFAEILELGATLGQVPSGRVVGIWTLADDCYSLFDRTPQQRVISR